MKPDENPNIFHYAYSCDISSNLSIKIGSLEGNLPKPDFDQIILNPILRFAGRNYESRTHYPSLVVEAVVMLENEELHIPVRTSYKHFVNRWSWNQWVYLPIKFCDLPRDSVLCFNIFDCNGPNDTFCIGKVFNFNRMTPPPSPPCKDSLLYPWNLYLNNNVEDIVVFLGLNCLILKIPLCFSAIEIPFCRETTIEYCQFTTLTNIVI